MSKNDLIRKLRLISKFMTSQTGQIIIAIRILPNILISKDNQATKFGQLINSWEMFLFKKYAENGVGILVPDLFFKRSFI